MKMMMYKNVVITFNVCDSFKDKSEHRGGWNVVKNQIQKYINTNSNILFLDTIEKHFLWDKKKAIKNKWFGFIHLTPVTPKYFDRILNLNNLFDLQDFKDSLPNCLFIITLSPYITNFLTDKFEELHINIKVFTILHPTDLDCRHFNFNNFIKNPNKQIIQVGQQLRKLSSIYRLKTNLEKVWLTGFKDLERCKRMLTNEIDYFNYNNIDYNSVKMLYVESFEIYDEYFSKNIIFVDLFDAAANNAIVECIARNTPILVNKIQGVVDYLGENYPLYFNNLDEIDSLLTDENVKNAHIYLSKLDKTFLNINNFMKDFTNIVHEQLIKDT
jgi:hypothetical protein